jgi:NhaA family Na+:H+ antiporter
VILGLLTPASAQLAKDRFLANLDSLTATFRHTLQAGDEHGAEAALGEIEDLVQATEAPVERLERILHPFTSYLVIPIFALANAGLEFSGDSIRDAATSSVTLGIAIGLLAGKFFGILGASWLAVRFGVAVLPTGGRWSQIAGVAMLAGIGFTVSLFITGLAFDDEVLISDAKMGIFGASLIAGIAGYTLLRLTTRST